MAILAKGKWLRQHILLIMQLSKVKKWQRRSVLWDGAIFDMVAASAQLSCCWRARTLLNHVLADVSQGSRSQVLSDNSHFAPHRDAAACSTPLPFCPVYLSCTQNQTAVPHTGSNVAAGHGQSQDI